QALPLVILVADVKRSQPDDHCQRLAPEAGERVDDLFQLVAEENTDKYEGSGVEQRTQTIKEEKTRSGHAGAAGQRRREGAQTRDEFRHDNAPHPISAKKVLSPTNARVRLQRD